MDLEVRDRIGIQDAVGILEIAAQLNGPNCLLHLRVNETRPQDEMLDANRNGALEFKHNLLIRRDLALKARLNDMTPPGKQ